MNIKKHLSFTALRKMASNMIRTWTDFRRQGSVVHSVHDAVMSGLACMCFQEPSLLQFQRELEQATHNNNLKTTFGVKGIPNSNTIEEVLENRLHFSFVAKPSSHQYLLKWLVTYD